MTFSERFKYLREEHELTQRDFTNSFNKKYNLNISYPTVSYWETGREPNYDVLKKIAEYFNCSTDYLLGLSIYKNFKEYKKATELPGIQTNFLTSNLDSKQLGIAIDLLEAITQGFTLFKGERFAEDGYVNFLSELTRIMPIGRKFTLISQRLDAYERSNTKITEDYSYIYHAVEAILHSLLKLRQAIFKDLEDYQKTNNEAEAIDNLLFHTNENGIKEFEMLFRNIKNEISD